MPPPKHVIFAGTPDFAVPSLQALIGDSDFSIDLVITQPDKPVGRKQVLTPPPVKVVAEENAIEVWQPESINKEFSTFSTSHSLTPPDFLVVVAYGQILSPEILAWPTIAPINVHASLLPRWRGASPIQHALLASDSQTGVTIQQMVKELDAGPVLAQETLKLDERMTAPKLHDTLAQMGASLLIKTLNTPLSPQPQHEEAVTVCKKLSRQDGRCDPATMTAAEIDRRVRALVPWPGVTCNINGHDVKLMETTLEPTEDSISVQCADDSTLYVGRLQSPGKKPTSGTEWQKGHVK